MIDPSDPEPKDEDPSGLSSGIPAAGILSGGDDPLGRPGLNHWRESTITEPGLDDRGNVFFAAIEMTRMPMILTDPNQPDNPIVFGNKAFLDLTGYEEAEIVGRNCRFLQGPQTDRNAVAELRQAVAAKQSIALELLNYRRDGSPFWNAVFIGPVYDVAGKLLYFFASQLDVSRRRNAEQSHRQAQKMESIGQLTAGLAHDFNNLLQVVNGNLELIGAAKDPDRVRRYTDAARTAAERGAKLTRQLLAFARKSRLEPRPLDLSRVISDFSALIETSIQNRAELRLDLPQGLPLAVIDVDQLEMALLNIVANARDAMPQGGCLTISASAEQVGDDPERHDLVPGEYLALRVRDEGVGMPRDVLERATEPFFTTKTVDKGTGLGLATASGFARQSGGRLEIESEEGFGTTVTMLFPSYAGEAAGTELADDGSTGIVHEGHSEHILVVEDHDEVRALAQEILEGAGYRISVAASGDEGLAMFDTLHAKQPIDLIFTDLVMPGSINGLMLADAIIARDRAVSVLMTTGYNEELVAGGPRKHAADVLNKPYRRSELLDRIHQALNRHGEGAERRHPSDYGAAQA